MEEEICLMPQKTELGPMTYRSKQYNMETATDLAFADFVLVII